MSYKQDVYNITKQNVAALAEIRKSLDNLKAEQKNLSKERYQELLQEQADKRQAVISEGKQKIVASLDHFKNTVHDRYTLRGEDVTDDMKLLNGLFNISCDDLKAMFDKYEGNYTMQKAIYDYAESKDISVGVLKTEANAVNDAEILLPYYDSVMSRPEWDDIWLNEDYYKNVTNDIEDD